MGIAIRDVEDGRTIVNFVTPDSPADSRRYRSGRRDPVVERPAHRRLCRQHRALLLALLGGPCAAPAAASLCHARAVGQRGRDYLQEPRRRRRIDRRDDGRGGERKLPRLVLQRGALGRGIAGRVQPARQRPGLCQDLQLLRQRVALRPVVGTHDAEPQRERHSGADHRHAPEWRRQRFPGRPDGGLLLQRAAGTGHVRLLRRESGRVLLQPGAHRSLLPAQRGSALQRPCSDRHRPELRQCLRVLHL